MAQAGTDRLRPEPQPDQAGEGLRVGDKVSNERRDPWLPAAVQEPIKIQIEILLDRIKNAPDGQEWDRVSGGCRGDGRAFHIHGERS